MAAFDATMHTDGASKGNPGPAAIGVLIVAADGTTLAEISERVGTKTNNEAEYLALIRGLEECGVLGLKRVQWFSDSELVVRQWNGVYRIKQPHLQRLMARARSLASDLEFLLGRHTLRSGNSAADSLANRAFKRG